MAGRPYLHCLVYQAANFGGMRFGQRAAKYGEILAVSEHGAAVDAPTSSDNTIACKSAWEPNQGWLEHS